MEASASLERFDSEWPEVLASLHPRTDRAGPSELGIHVGDIAETGRAIDSLLDDDEEVDYIADQAEDMSVDPQATTDPQTAIDP